MESTVKHPVALLHEIERRCREHAAGLPLQVEVKNTKLAIGFRIGTLTLAAPLDEVKEILTYPSLSKVPGAKPWVKGIANVRGNLLPIMDLQGCLGSSQTAINKHSRVLVVNHQEVFAGLLVDEVLGLKHFLDEEQTRELPSVDGPVGDHLKGAYLRDGQHWGVFSMRGFVESARFMQVAV